MSHSNAKASSRKPGFKVQVLDHTPASLLLSEALQTDGLKLLKILDCYGEGGDISGGSLFGNSIFLSNPKPVNVPNSLPPISLLKSHQLCIRPGYLKWADGGIN